MQAIPDKDYYKVAEVCQYTDTQPYVLRFWESEFPQLNPSRGNSGQSVYRREDIDLVLRIKQLLYDEEYSIADARETLDREASNGKKKRGPAKKKAPPKASKPAKTAAAKPVAPPPVEPDPAPAPTGSTAVVARERYEDAVEEISHLRLQLKEAETRCRKAEQDADGVRDRAERAAERLERLVQKLGGAAAPRG